MTRRILHVCLFLAFLLAAIPAHAQVPSAFPYVKPVQNDSSVGTTQFTLTKINSSGNAVIMATTDTNGYSGVCISNCGKTGTAWIAFAGLVPLTVDATATVQHYITISSTTGGDGHDSGAATYPTSGAVIGRVQAGATSGNPAMVDLFSAEVQAASGGTNPTATGIQAWTGSAWRSTAVTQTDISALGVGTGGGTANAQTVTLSPAITSYTPGLVCWLPVAPNTSNTVTLAVNGLAAVNIVGPNGATTIQANDIITSRYACAFYDGTNFELQTRQTPMFTGTGIFTGGLIFDNVNSTYTNYLQFGNTANQEILGGPSGNSMLRGILTITNPATSATETFPLSSSGQAYTNQPVCALGPLGSASVTGTPYIDTSSSNLQLVVKVPTTPTSSISIYYVCVANPN